jgi:hypothetical protein
MPERNANHLVRPLPSNPNLEKRRKLAEALARNYWRGDLEAIERVRALHPNPPAPQIFALRVRPELLRASANPWPASQAVDRL